MIKYEISRWTWTVVTLRYTFGYLCAAFLISAPLKLIIKESESYITFSIAYGAILGVAALLFLPLGNFDWKRITVPKFKLFELGVSRNAAIIAGVLLLGRVLYGSSRFFPPTELSSLVFMLMGFSYLKGKAHTIFFRELYEEEIPKEDSVTHLDRIMFGRTRFAKAREKDALDSLDTKYQKKEREEEAAEGEGKRAE